MAAVHFYLKRSKGAEFHIVLSFIYQKRGKPFRFYTNLYSPPDYWDSKKERVSPPTKKRFDQAVEINNTLVKLQTGTMRLKLRFDDERKVLTDEILKNELEALRFNDRPKSGQTTFLQYFEQFVEAKTSVPNYVKNSAKAYITTLKHVREYAKDTGSKFDFPDINRALLEGFIKYLQGKDFQPNHVQKIASTLKTVLRIADQEEISPNFKLKSEWLFAQREETDATYLKKKELEKLENIDLATNPRLERVRDLFLIGCYTGLRFSDYSVLNPNCFAKDEEGKIKLSLRAKKTGSPVTYPLFPNAERILVKYDFHSPVRISNAKMNEYLKELGQMAEIDEPFTYSKRVKGERKSLTCPKWQKISTHTARRTFATNAMAGGVPVELIMHMTGHKNMVDFFKYIRFTHDEKNLRIKNHPYFIGGENRGKPEASRHENDKNVPNKWLL